MKNAGVLSEIDRGVSFFSLSRNVANCGSLEDACLLYEEFLQQFELTLLSVKFCDIDGEHPAIRPFAGYPAAISKISFELRDIGGCPITKEAIRQLAPFDAVQINSRDYNDFLSARFLAELKKMDHKHIAVVPLIVGQGLMLTTIGLNQKAFVGEVRELVVMNTCNFGIAVAQRFGDVSDLFRSNILTQKQAQALFLYSSGFSIRQIGHIFQLGEVTINLLLKGASDRLGASNLAEATARALGSGEISNLHQ